MTDGDARRAGGLDLALGLRPAEAQVVGQEVPRTGSRESGVGEPDRVESCRDVGAGVARTGDLVEQLGGDGADGDRAAGPVVFGDDGRPVVVQFRDRVAGASPVGDLVGPGVVAAGGLRSALDDVPGRDGTGGMARLFNGATGKRKCVLNDQPNWVTTTVAGTYTSSIWVRADQAGSNIS